MSRSNNTELKNPATKHFEWNGESGGFRYFDKSIGEKGERVKVDLPFRFLVLDCLNTIKGFDDQHQSGYWSNEVRNIKADKLTVRNKKGVQYEGLYDSLDLVGSKYCQSVYIAFYDGTELTIGNLALTGTALSAWIDFRKKAKIYEGAIEVAEMVEGRKGKTIYQTPVFKSIEIKPETDEKAKELDKELQEYLTAYFARSGKVESEVVAETGEYKPELPPIDVSQDELPADDLPF